MKNTIKLFSCLTILLLQACANIHHSVPGEKVFTQYAPATDAKPTADLRISGELDYSMETEYFRALNFTLENPSGHWIRIKELTLDFDDEQLNAAIDIPVGTDIVDWVKAMKTRNKMTSYNESLFLSGLVLLGAAASVQGDSGTQNAGAVMASGGVAGILTKDINQKLDRIQNAQLLPETHLLAGPFSIPPGLFVKKWILLHSAVPHDISVKQVYIRYELHNGERGKIRLPIKFFLG